MSYKSTRIYVFKLLDRLIDYDSLVDNAITALSVFGTTNHIDGFVGCTLELLYPDLNLVEDLKGFCSMKVRPPYFTSRTLLFEVFWI